MAKIQVIMALTLDGFLPHEDEMLMRMGEGKQTVWFPTLAATGHIPHLPPLRFDGLAECKGKA